MRSMPKICTANDYLRYFKKRELKDTDSLLHGIASHTQLDEQLATKLQKPFSSMKKLSRTLRTEARVPISDT